MQVRESLLDLVGDTPLVRLGRVARELPATVLAKIEYLNPGGSSKDRIALRMVERAEAEGRLRPGGTIVEPTSGNTGVGLAMVAALRGYQAVFTCPDKVSPERIDLLRAFGATVEVCPATAGFDQPEFYRNRARALAGEIPGGCLLDQYANPANPRAHFDSTGPEIWRQTDGTVTCFVAGVGTGGTISGTGSYLKQVSGGAVSVVGADPDGSIYTSQTLRPYLVEGVGQPTLPASYDPSVPDQLISVTDAESLAMTRRLAREEGLLAGGSGGMAVVAALRMAAKLTEDDVVVVLIPDSGRGYLSKIFSSEWMARRGFSCDPPGPGLPGSDTLGTGTPGTGTPGTLGAALGALAGRPALVSVTARDPMATALATMRSRGLTALPVTAAAAPVRLAEIAGTITESAILAALVAGVPLDSPIGPLLAPPLPFAGAGQPVAEALPLLSEEPTLLVLDGGLVRGVLSRADLITFLAATTGHGDPQ